MKCDKCGQPMLSPVAKRKNVHDYRHARFCPNASASERKATEKLWEILERQDGAKAGKEG